MTDAEGALPVNVLTDYRTDSFELEAVDNWQ